MSAPTAFSRARNSRTYLPDDRHAEALAAIAKTIREIDEIRFAPVLLGPDGSQTEVPLEVFLALEHVVVALANGNGVTIAPNDLQMTTQEAADYLGISRPTLVKLLDGKEIAHEKRGRHRRVLLRDLVDYKQRSRVERRNTLREVAGDSLDMDSAPLSPLLRRTELGGL